MRDWSQRFALGDLWRYSAAANPAFRSLLKTVLGTREQMVLFSHPAPPIVVAHGVES